jgi:aminoglycoside phosphotransferase (APT) family kinase protein
MATKKVDYNVLPGFKTYPSGVQLLHRSCNRRIWSLGSMVVCKESPITPAETPFDDHAIYEFIEDKTTIPVPSVISEWVDTDNNIHFAIKEKIPGESLDQLWPTMSWEDKERMADETAEYLRQLRGLTSPYCGRVEETGVVDQMLFNCQYPEPQGPFRTQDELWKAMVATLKGQIPKKALDRLRSQMPDCGPWTYTHGDLSLGNIIVEKGKVVGLIDWEWSGYFPVWWEYAKFRGGVPRWIEPEWWELLAERMDKYPEAYEFWEKYHSLVHKVESVYRSMDPRKIRLGNAALEELLDDANGVSLS